MSQSGFDQAKMYVLEQQERHARRALYGVLERSGDEEDTPVPR